MAEKKKNSLKKHQMKKYDSKEKKDSLKEKKDGLKEKN